MTQTHLKRRSHFETRTDNDVKMTQATSLVIGGWEVAERKGFQGFLALVFCGRFSNIKTDSAFPDWDGPGQNSQFVCDLFSPNFAGLPPYLIHTTTHHKQPPDTFLLS